MKKVMRDTREETILIIDDAIDTLFFLDKFLSAHGYTIHTSSDSSTALAMAKELTPDLIILDIMMPVLNGYELCETLKADEAVHNIPVIFISAINQIQDKVKAFQVGGVDYINKPFQADEILARINTHLTNRRLQRDLEHQNKRLAQEVQERKRAESALRQSEGRYRLLSESVSDYVYTALIDVDGNWQTEWVAGAIEQITGYTLQDVKQEKNGLLKFIHPEDIEKFKNKFKQLLQRQTYTFEYRILTKDGSVHWVHDYIRLVRDEDSPSVVRALGAVQDITAKKLAEQALRESEHRYRELVESQHDLLVCRWLPNTTLTFVNQAYCRFFGKSKEELLGMPYTNLLPNQTTIDKVKAVVDNLCNTLQSATYEHQVISVDGNICWFRWTDQPIIDKTGSLVEFQSFGVNITKRKKAEEAIQQTNQELKQLVDELSTLNQITRAIATVTDIETSLGIVAQKIVHHFNVRGTIISLVNRQTAELQIVADYHNPLLNKNNNHGMNGTHIASTVGVAITTDDKPELDWIVTMQESAILNHHQIPQKLPDLYQIMSARDTKIVAVIPILVRGEVIGILMVYTNHISRQFNDSEIRLAETIATQIAGSIETIRLFEQNKRDKEATEAANKVLKRLVGIDTLTQVANRRRLDQYLEEQWHILIKKEQSLALILADIDYFKPYNDTYGHQAGDKTLKNVAQAISRATRHTTDLVARYGGEEFAIILPNSDVESALIVAERIQVEVKKLRIVHDKSKVSNYITLSIGVTSVIPKPEYSLNTLLGTADVALYEAKSLGRNRIRHRLFQSV